MHQKAKARIKECYEKNKNGDPAYKSLTQSMRARLRFTVGEKYWKKGHDYLDHFFRQRQEEAGKRDKEEKARLKRLAAKKKKEADLEDEGMEV